MRIKWQDYNDSAKAIEGEFKDQWNELKNVLDAMPLHLQPSDQKGKVGQPIFDPKGTNRFIAESLVAERKWLGKIPIPAEFDFLGDDIDFGKSGVVVEIQFSNYPFLLNNVLRAELFYNAKIPLNNNLTGVAVIVTKAGKLPASNSTLYYEQAERQLAALSKYKLFSVPIRLVGLFPEEDDVCTVMWTDYGARYRREGTGEERVCRARLSKQKMIFELMDRQE